MYTIAAELHTYKYCPLSVSHKTVGLLQNDSNTGKNTFLGADHRNREEIMFHSNTGLASITVLVHC